MDATTTSNPPGWFFLFILLLLYFTSKVHLTISTDTLSVGQSLTGNQTIISKGGIYELGFFSPGKSLKYYIGIWYKKVPVRSVVWVANRENPLLHPYSSELKLLDNGNLVLYDHYKMPIWSTSSISNTMNSSEVVLDDDGNFALRDVSNHPAIVIWQSIDYPTNTFLPGGKLGFNKRTSKSQILTSWKSEEDPAPGVFSVELHPDGTSQFIIKWNRNRTFWRSGLWNEETHIFDLVPEMRLNYLYNFSYIRNDGESYFTYSLYNKTLISRLVMDYDGRIKQYTWSYFTHQWNLFWSQPKQPCDVYGICGAFGSCNQDTYNYKCDCLQGFEKRSPNGSDTRMSGSSTGGCVRRIPLQCGNKDDFSRISNMNMPADPQPLLEVGSAEECKVACTGRCSCNAYNYDASNNGCSLWDGDLLSLQQLSDGEGDLFYLRLADSDNTISTNNKTYSQGKRIPIWIIILIITLGTSILAVLGYMFLRRKKANQRDSLTSELQKDGVKDGETPELQLFDLISITIATNNFSLTNKLGEGGFGPVYKGRLQNGQEIAVKRLSKSSGQGIECVNARMIWMLIPGYNHDLMSENSSFTLWYGELDNKRIKWNNAWIKLGDLYAAIVCWHLWKMRCKRVFDNDVPNLVEVVTGICVSLDMVVELQCKKAIKLRNKQNSIHSSELNKLESNHFWIAEFSYDETIGKCVGLNIADHSGCSRARRIIQCDHFADSRGSIYYRGLMEMARFIKELNIDHVQIRSDDARIKRVMINNNDESDSRTDLNKRLIEEAKFLLKDLNYVSFMFLQFKKEAIVSLLCKSGIWLTETMSWIDSDFFDGLGTRSYNQVANV